MSGNKSHKGWISKYILMITEYMTNRALVGLEVWGRLAYLDCVFPVCPCFPLYTLLRLSRRAQLYGTAGNAAGSAVPPLPGAQDSSWRWAVPGLWYCVYSRVSNRNSVAHYVAERNAIFTDISARFVAHIPHPFAPNLRLKVYFSCASTMRNFRRNKGL